MNVPAVLVEDLRLLTEVLDGSRSDIAATLMFLISEAAVAVPSYLGLSVLLLRGAEPALQIATFPRPPDPGLIGTSLRFRVSGDSEGTSTGLAQIELSLYASQPGALVDLAADLTWLTGRPSADFRIDEEPLEPLSDAGMSLASWSTVNQARGVLMGRGLTVEESDMELGARASAGGIGRHLAAAELLAGLPSSAEEA